MILSVTDLAVSFDGFCAVDGLGLAVEEDELRCVIGPNGAGKTTLLDMICGKTRPTRGSIRFKDHELTEMIEYDVTRMGVGRKFQTPSTYEDLTWLEIGMLLMQDPELLLLDEPVAGMSPRERERTAELLLGISAGRSTIVIEHDMAFVRMIAHKVTVMHQGKVLAEGTMDDIQRDERVIEVYLGG